MSGISELNASQNYFIKLCTSPWEVVPEGTSRFSIKRIFSAARSVAGTFLFGPVPAIVCGTAQRIRSDRVVKFFGAPWELIDESEEDAGLKQVLVSIASLSTSFAVAHVASKYLPKSLLDRSVSFLSSKIHLVEWLQSNLFPISDWSRALTFLGIHASASLILSSDGFFQLSNEVGSRADYYCAHNLDKIFITVRREFLEKHPEEVLKLYSQNLEKYTKEGKHLLETQNTRVAFQNEMSPHDEGPTREFFFLLFVSLLKTKRGKYKNILSFTDADLKVKGSFEEYFSFYRAVGMVLGAIAKTDLSCSVGGLLSEPLVTAILVPTEFDLCLRLQKQEKISYADESPEIQGVLKAIAAVLYKENECMLAALSDIESIDPEDMEGLMAEPERVLEMSLGMLSFYSGSDQANWTSLRERPQLLIDKIIGSMDKREVAARIQIDMSVDMNKEQKEVIETKVGWLKDWILNKATKTQIKNFLIYFSGNPVIVFHEYTIFPEPSTKDILGSVTCHGKIKMAYKYTKGVDDTREYFIGALIGMISSESNTFTSA